MKTRQGFVSNSSSASFSIDKRDITIDQLEKIRDYQEVAREMGATENGEGRFGWLDEFWTINEDTFVIRGNTIMDNFDMFEFLEAIGIPKEKINSDNGWN